VSMGDWLGTGYVHPADRVYLPFVDARTFARGLGLKNVDEWQAYWKSDQRPADIPSDPSKVYKDQGWLSWGDWLGTGVVASCRREHLPFEEARAFVRGLGLASGKEWSAWSKSDARPANIPRIPWALYKDSGWLGMGDWLGTGYVHTADRVFRPFAEARAFSRGLGLKNAFEWNAYSRSDERPADIPSDPGKVYKDSGWLGMGDWLGTGYVHTAKRVFRPFAEARAFAHGLGLKGKDEFQAYSSSGKRPADIPSNPWDVYKDQGWVGWGDWLGNGYVPPADRGYLPFADARAFARGLGLKNGKEWKAYSHSDKKPVYVPSDPGRVYEDSGWVGMGDWLGTGFVAHADRVFRPFAEAREFAPRPESEELRRVAGVLRVRREAGRHPEQPAGRVQGPGLGGLGRLAGDRVRRHRAPPTQAVCRGPHVRPRPGSQGRGSVEGLLQVRGEAR